MVESSFVDKPVFIYKGKNIYIFIYILIQRWQCPIYNGTFTTDKKCERQFIFWVEKCFYLNCEFLQCFRKSARHFRRETANENKQFKETIMLSLISNSYLIRQRFQEYRCESGLAIFAWRITGNYTYNPFNMTYL